jgi:hypothetical protein
LRAAPSAWLYAFVKVIPPTGGGYRMSYPRSERWIRNWSIAIRVPEPDKTDTFRDRSRQPIRLVI